MDAARRLTFGYRSFMNLLNKSDFPEGRDDLDALVIRRRNDSKDLPQPESPRTSSLREVEVIMTINEK